MLQIRWAYTVEQNKTTTGKHVNPLPFQSLNRKVAFHNVLYKTTRLAVNQPKTHQVPISEGLRSSNTHLIYFPSNVCPECDCWLNTPGARLTESAPVSSQACMLHLSPSFSTLILSFSFCKIKNQPHWWQSRWGTAYLVQDACILNCILNQRNTR